MPELFWLLLPVAAFSGWVIGRRESGSRRPQPAGSVLPQEYFQGLNYLISEQPDKAIEVFTRMVEVDSETVETHLALGNLFRRRGEVDRAIRIHQNLIARPSLDREQRSYALLQLGEDYMRAGLLDRAENLFVQVVEFNLHVEPALKQLLMIYQQEKEWDNAISAAQRLESRASISMSGMIAQFYCEQVELARQQGDLRLVRQLIRRALSQDPNCARASILLGNLEREQRNFRAAIKAYQRVKNQDMDFLPEVLEPMYKCYSELGQVRQMMRYLQDLLDEHPGPIPMIMLSELIHTYTGGREAISFVAEQLRRKPTVLGLSRLIDLTTEAADESLREGVSVLRGAFSELLRGRPSYECRRCGFTAKSLYWQCPSCKNWATVKPFLGTRAD